MYAGFRGSSKFVGPAAPSTQRRREESVAKSRSFGTFYRSKRVPLKHRAKQGKSFMLYLFNDSSCLMISRRLYLINLERRGLRLIAKVVTFHRVGFVVSTPAAGRDREYKLTDRLPQIV